LSLRSSILFSKSLIFPKTEKKSSARKSILGAFLCIGLSVVPLIVVISVTNGMIGGMTQRIIGLSSSHLDVFVAKGIEQTKSYKSFTDYSQSFLKINGVKKVSPEVSISALAVGKNYRTGIQIRGVEKNIFSSNSDFKTLFSILDGNIKDFEENTNYAIIGQKMAETLSLKAGDSFRIITTNQTQNKISPKMTVFKVAAIVSSGYQELDQLWVFVPIETAFKSFSLLNASFNILIETQDAFSPELVRTQRDIKRFAGKYANVYRWDEVHSAEFENFSSTKVMLIFVMMMIVLVASINISSAIVMLIMERKREIAILKCVGATPKEICISFLIAGLSCGIGGLLIGLPIGLLLSVKANSIVFGLEKLVNHFAKTFYIFKGVPLEDIKIIKLLDPAYYLQEIPVAIPVKEIIIVTIATLILSVIVSIIPAVKAGKEKPVAVL